MLSSENKYHIAISFNQRIEGIQLTLINGILETVYSGTTEQLNIELAEGIYKLIAKFIDYAQEYPLIIDESKMIYLDFNYPSVAPIFSFATTNENFYRNAEKYSRLTTETEPKSNPSFLFFSAKYYINKFENTIMENFLANYSIINGANEILYQFNSQNTRFSNENGWFAFSRKLENGQYFLKWNGEMECRIFPFYVFEEYQTQFFIRYLVAPHFENCFFFYTKKLCFNVYAEEYLVLDKILFAFKDFGNYKLLTEKDINIIQQHPYLITLVRLLHSVLGKKFDLENFEYLMLTDLIILSDNQNEVDIYEVLPVLSTVMNKYTNKKNNKKPLFKPASLVDRTIDHIRYDLFWNNFSKIDYTGDWLDKYSKFVKKSDRFPVGRDDNQILKMSKRFANTFVKAKKSTIEERLNSLTGMQQMENYERAINDTFNSIADVSKISDKLNLPPTKILRNYETYKDIYDKLK